MPLGRREMSLRSSASSTATEIFVALAICRSETPRRSRAARSMPPKSPLGRSADMNRERSESMLGSCFQAVNEETDAGDAVGARGEHRFDAIWRDSADRQYRHRTGFHNVAQTFETEQLCGKGRRLRHRRKYGSGDQIVGARGERGLLDRVNRSADEQRRRHETPRILDRIGIAAQVDAVGAAGERNVEAVVHDDTRS